MKNGNIRLQIGNKMMCTCGPTRGKYSKPVPFNDSPLNFVDDDYNTMPPPLKHPCDHPEHWNWGNGTRNGQKLYYPLAEMFVQKWHLTQKELKAAIAEYDMFSLEMPTRIICANCASKINQNK